MYINSINFYIRGDDKECFKSDSFKWPFLAPKLKFSPLLLLFLASKIVYLGSDNKQRGLRVKLLERLSQMRTIDV